MKRFLSGGLPGFFLSGLRDDRDYSEWMEAFWARDIQGMYEIPSKNKGIFWEHLVLNELKAGAQEQEILSWRDKQGHEVDFVLAPRGSDPVAIEVKWSSDAFETGGLKAFRALHPGSVPKN
ncbi:MAG: DUF4143 domain-containing protein [Rectinemataceae bacterium]|nr:DUF4143 domain-containing protein [Rectinemataceae bacterium]